MWQEPKRLALDCRTLLINREEIQGKVDFKSPDIQQVADETYR